MNKKEIFKIIVIILFIGVIGWSVGAKYISSHEFIHYKIFANYNITSIIKIDYLTCSGLTTPNPFEYYRCNDMCKFEHFLNDLVGYSLALFIYFLTVFTLIILFLLKWKKDVSSVER